LLLLSAVALVHGQIAFAQGGETGEIPASVVLVLKLVSSTHVRPTTGVVISTDGQVIVAADFVKQGDEIVVMDGGTDILRHGLPARTVKRSVDDGLAVLSVDGLKRPAITFADGEIKADEGYHLAAFPPAEQLAQGEKPLWLPVSFEVNESGVRKAVTAGNTLPNVSGIIIDHCGQLAGLNLAEGSQSLNTEQQPLTILADQLNSIFESMKITLPAGRCVALANLQDEASKNDEAGKPTPAVTSAKNEPGTPEPAISEDDAPGVGAESAVQNDASVDQLPTTATPSKLSLVPGWLWVLGILVLAIVIIKVIVNLRLSGKPASKKSQANPASTAPLVSDEPVTAQLEEANVSLRQKPAKEPQQVPDVNTLPDGHDGIVFLENLQGDRNEFQLFCVVDSKNIDIIIGRGDADISIEAGSISRNHARLKLDGELLTLSDLGSSNGTFIRGIPCLPEEIMFIEAEDEIQLGDVHCRIRLQTAASDDKDQGLS
jgi:pSer/pThr/pTyr-binding forkhead associated (FHA) protein